MKFLFYRKSALVAAALPDLPPGYHIKVWKPSVDGMPGGLVPWWPNIIWWGLDRLGILRNRHTGLMMILKDDRIAHRSLVTAGYYRFPEMKTADLQIGDTWTDPRHRGNGLATSAIGIIQHHWRGCYDHMWYIVEDDNAASIRVIEKCAFLLAGRGRRTRPFNLAIIGQFVLDRFNPTHPE